MLGELLRANWPCVGLGCDAVHFRVAAVGGFAPCEALWRRVAGVSEAWMASFPPLVGGGAAAPRDGVAAQIADHLAHYCPFTSFFAEVVCDLGKTEWCVMSCSHVNPLLRVWAGLPRLVLAGYVRIRGPMCGLEGPRARCRAHMQTIGPACVFVGVHVAVLLRMDFSCCGGSDHAGNGGSWAPLLAVLTLQCGAKPT